MVSFPRTPRFLASGSWWRQGRRCWERIVGYTMLSSSRCSCDPCLVRNIYLKIFVTVSCESTVSNCIFRWQKTEVWNMLLCSVYRCFELIFMFMHDHDDVQWHCQGLSMARNPKFNQHNWVSHKTGFMSWWSVSGVFRRKSFQKIHVTIIQSTFIT